jgi:hypothetical protein
MGENVNDGRDGVDDVFFPPAVKKTRVVLSRLVFCWMPCRDSVAAHYRTSLILQMYTRAYRDVLESLSPPAWLFVQLFLMIEITPPRKKLHLFAMA